MCISGWESEYPFSVNSYESEYPKNDESGHIYESGKISSSVNLVLDSWHFERVIQAGKFEGIFGYLSVTSLRPNRVSRV